ncbi:MAG: hypothetical protein PHU33_14885 [Bacteroidales bacterium]|nr:hypothetical protein [Bacteroidales bacterium]
MKRNIVRLFLLFFIIPFFLKAQGVENKTNFDTIAIHFNELIDIDYRFKIILDDFIQQIPFRVHKHQRTSFIFVKIDAYLTYKAPTRLIDSLYQDNDFQKSIYPFPYSVYIESIKKESKKLLSISELQLCYLYNYMGFDVIFVSPMNLNFPWLGPSKIRQYFVSKTDDFTATYFSVYTIGDYEVVKRNYTKLYSTSSGVPLKNKYCFDKEKADLLKREK